MNEITETLKKVCSMILSEKTGSEDIISAEYISEVINQFKFMPRFKKDWDKVELAELQKKLEANFSHSPIESAKGLVNSKDHEPWLENKKGKIDWAFWDRFKEFKITSDIGKAGVEIIDDLSEKVLGSLEDPNRPGPWSTRGMVMGHVQSGKTGSYTGLINKAADAGYKIIIVLAGLHNNLRAQTQVDIDEGFLGWNSETRKKTGVGRHNYNKKLVAHSFTTQEDSGDFKKQSAKTLHVDPNSNQIMTFIIKKNVTPLKNLFKWLESYAPNEDAIDGTAKYCDGSEKKVRKYFPKQPILIIDDECDQASIDIKKHNPSLDGELDPEYDPSKINCYIRSLLILFRKSAYVGFTATPFANVLINKNTYHRELGADLFPSNFIYNLSIPDVYYGAEKIFGLRKDDTVGIEEQDELPLFEEVYDHIDVEKTTDVIRSGINEAASGWMPPKVKAEHFPYYKGEDRVPPSLEMAIKEFILSCTVRHIREGFSIFNSMLVHVTRLKDIQGRVTHQVKESLKNIINSIKNDKENQGIFRELETLWRERFVPKNKVFKREDLPMPEWNEIKKELLQTVEKIVIREINGRAKDILDYKTNEKQGWSVIAIGGAKLSRGLVLKGLTVSYFIRTSDMYDTLMQMGRWFGYKHNYIDVCRLYITNDLKESYRSITNASAELRSEFDYMEALGANPDQWGMKVRSHPGMLVAAKAKTRSTEERRMSFEGQTSQTIIFDTSKKINEINKNAVISLIEKSGNALENYEKARFGGFIWRGFNHENIIDFFNEYQTHPDAGKVNSENIKRYISIQSKKDELIDWSVVIPSVKKTDKNKDFSNYFWGDLTINGVSRSNINKGMSGNKVIIKTLASPSDESADLDQEKYEEALNEYQLWWKEEPKNKSKTLPNVPQGKYIRRHRNKSSGLLIIYPISIEGISFPVIGIAVSFPESDTAESVSYVVPSYQQEDLFV